MRLLLVTQKLDKNDSILGFFHSWVEEFAKHCESIIVICLFKGEYDLPSNVHVLSLGKEEKQSRLQYLIRFYQYIFNERKNYDAVFVHMNQIYVVLGGLLWKMWKKKIALWYTHKSVTPGLRLSVSLADIIFTASKESFRINTPNVRVMGHGIDADYFSLDFEVNREGLLSVGRLMPVKRHDLAIQAAALAGKPLRIAGEGPEQMKLQVFAEKLGARVEFLGPLDREQLRKEYLRNSFLIHTSETGSLDKVVLEALACGLPVISTSGSLGDVPIIQVSPTAEAIAEAVTGARVTDRQALAEYVRSRHSLSSLIPAIINMMQNL